MAVPGENPVDVSAFRGNWQLDPDTSTIEFHTKALWVFPTKGTFTVTGGSGTVTPDGGISGTVVVDAASIHTGNKKRDAHLRTADFFEVETFPTITYEVTGGRPAGPGRIDLDGNLTVHGQTKPLAVSAAVVAAADSVTVSVDVPVDRSDWGLTATPFGAGLQNRLVVRARFTRA